MPFLQTVSASEIRKNDLEKITVSIAESTGGYINFTGSPEKIKSKVSPGSEVSFVINADDGYGVDTVRITDAYGGAYDEPINNGKVVIKPMTDITVRGNFFVLPEKETEVESKNSFDMPVTLNEGAFLSTTDYIKIFSDKSKVGTGEIKPYSYLLAMNLIVDDTVDADFNFDSYNKDSDGYLKLVNSDISERIVYEFDKTSDYLVSYVGTNIENAEIIDTFIGKNDEQNPVPYTDIIYDKSKGLVYIPRDRFKSPDSDAVLHDDIRVSVLYRVPYNDNGEYISKTYYSIHYSDNNIETGYMNLDSYTSEIVFDKLKDINIKDIYVNDTKLIPEQYSFDNGVLTIYASALSVRDIRIVSDTSSFNPIVSFINTVFPMMKVKAGLNPNLDGVINKKTKKGYRKWKFYDTNGNAYNPKAGDFLHVGGQSAYFSYPGDPKFAITAGHSVKYKKSIWDSKAEKYVKDTNDTVLTFDKLKNQFKGIKKKLKLNVDINSINAFGYDFGDDEISSYRTTGNQAKMLKKISENFDVPMRTTTGYETLKHILTNNSSEIDNAKIHSGDIDDDSGHSYSSLSDLVNDFTRYTYVYSNEYNVYRAGDSHPTNDVTDYSNFSTVGTVDIPDDYKTILYCSHPAKHLDAPINNTAKYNSRFFGKDSAGVVETYGPKANTGVNADRRGPRIKILSVNKKKGTMKIGIHVPDNHQAGSGIFTVYYETVKQPKSVYIKLEKHVKQADKATFKADDSMSLIGVKYRLYEDEALTDASVNKILSDTVTFSDTDTKKFSDHGSSRLMITKENKSKGTGTSPIMKIDLGYDDAKNPVLKDTFWITEQNVKNSDYSKSAPKFMKKLLPTGVTTNNNKLKINVDLTKSTSSESGNTITIGNDNSKSNPYVIKMTDQNGMANGVVQGHKIAFKKVFTQEVLNEIPDIYSRDLSGIVFNINGDEYKTNKNGIISVTDIDESDFDGGATLQYTISEVSIPNSLKKLGIGMPSGNPEQTVEVTKADWLANKTYNLDQIPNPKGTVVKDPNTFYIAKGIKGHATTSVPEGDIENLGDIMYKVEYWEARPNGNGTDLTYFNDLNELRNYTTGPNKPGKPQKTVYFKTLGDKSEINPADGVMKFHADYRVQPTDKIWQDYLKFSKRDDLVNEDWPYRHNHDNKTYVFEKGTYVVTEVFVKDGMYIRQIPYFAFLIKSVIENGRERYTKPKDNIISDLATTIDNQAFHDDVTSSLTDNNNLFSFVNPIKRGGVKVTKFDPEWDKSSPEGDADLANTAFEVINDSVHPVRVTNDMIADSVGVTLEAPDMDNNFYSVGSKIMTLRTVNKDGKYYVFSGANALPYGTYSIREVGPGEGYLFGDRKGNIFNNTFKIRTEGQVIDYSYKENDPAHTDIRVRAENEVMRGGVRVGKVDRETRKYTPLGGAVLHGAIFDVYNRSKNPVWVNNKEYAVGEVVTTLITKLQADGRYTDETTNQTLPYGTYEVVERETSTGYLYDKHSRGYKKTFSIRKDEDFIDLSKESADTSDHTTVNNKELAASNQVIREDWHFKKKFDDNSELQGNQNNGNRMPKIAWVVTSMTTGEKHVIVTDENGLYSSSIEMAKHDYKTNENDPVQPDGTYTGAKSNGAIEIRDGKYVVANEDKLNYNAGTWFTGIGPKSQLESKFLTWADDGKSYFVGGNKVIVDNNKRAYPYDVYSVEELRSKGNQGHALVKFDVTLYRYTSDHDGPGLNIDYGTIADDIVELKTELLQVNNNAIGTPAPNNTDNNNHPNYGPSIIGSKGSKTARADKDLVFLDTVEFNRLNIGVNYIMKGSLHIINEDGSVGDAISRGETKFRPTSPHGRVGVAFTGVDTSLMAGRKLVAYEEVWDEDLNLLVGLHKDKADEKQIVEIFLTFETSLQYQGGKQAPPAGDIVLSDTISYNGLAKGRTYDVRGELHFVDSNGNDGGLVKTMDGKDAIVRESFTATDTRGNHTVDFRGLDLRNLNGRKVVAFQYVYYQNRQIAYHSDLNDVNQTVKVEGKLRINTTLNANGSKTLEKKTNVVLNDTVAYYGLDIGKSYTLRGSIHKKLNNAEAGIVTTKTITFTPQSTSGTVAVTFDPVDFTAFNGDGVVAYEELWGDGQLLATHADITDRAQTVDFTITPQADGFGTVLTTIDGAKLMKNEVMTLVDTVSYTGLLVGQPYELKGTINVVDINTNTQERIIAEKTVQFTPTSPAGTVKVQFDGVDLRGLNNKKLVAFEYLYKDGKLINSHTNLNDEQQTVRPQSATPQPFVPTLGTMLATIEGYKTTINRVVDLIDHVSYFGLDTSKDYVLRGELHLFDKNGNFKRIIASENLTFRPKQPSDTIKLTFKDVDLRLENGSHVVAFENLYLGGVLVASHADKDDKNQTVDVRNDRVPRIGTTLVGDTDNEHSTVFSENSVVELTDRVFYQDLELNRRYIVAGVLMDKSTKKPYLDADGKMVLGSTPFVPQEYTGMVPVVFKFKPTKDLAGKTLVAYQTVRDITTGNDDYYKDYEYWKSLYFSDNYWDSLSNSLWLNAKPWHDYTGTPNIWYKNENPNKDNRLTRDYASKSVVYAFHADINDDGQAIHFVDIKTTAYDKKDNDKEIYPDGLQTVVDKVDLKNLTKNNTYTVTGILHERDKDGNDLGALMINNKPVSATKTFKADKPDMEVYLEFTFDAKLLEGHEIVVFESLYRDKKLLAVHADIKDEAQSVYVPKIGTMLTDHGSHFSKASTDAVKTRVVLTDTVSYTNLIKGDKYTLKGELRVKKVDKEGNVTDGGPLLVDGEPVVATKTFTAGDKYKPADNFGKKNKSKKKTVVSATSSSVTVGHSDNVTVSAVSVKDAESELAEIAKKTGNGTVDGKAFTSKAVSGKVDITFAFEAEDLANKTFVAYEKLYKGDKEITKHEDITDEGQTVRFPKIKTTLVDAPSLTKTVSGTTKVKLIDTVEYKNLIPGKTYTVKGTLHIKEINRDGKTFDAGILTVNNKPFIAETKFVPDEPNGKVDIVFDGDISDKYAGKTLVAFEEMYHDGYLIAVHNDIEDKAQSVYKPKIGTKLTLNDKRTKLYDEGKVYDMIDTVKYEGLTPGETYIMRGYLVDNKGSYLKDNAGVVIMKEEKFRPITSSGQIEIHFGKVNTSGYGKIVAFEELFTVNKILIASHRDVDDEDQTLNSRTKPNKPNTPNNPPTTPNNPPSNPNTPVNPTPKTPEKPTQSQTRATLKTGVENYGIAVAFALMAVVTLAGAVLYMKKKETDSE